MRPRPARTVPSRLAGMVVLCVCRKGDRGRTGNASERVGNASWVATPTPQRNRPPAPQQPVPGKGRDLAAALSVATW